MRFFLFFVMTFSMLLGGTSVLVESVKGKTFTVTAQGVVGMSAVVMRTIDNYETILAQAHVIAVEGERLVLHSAPYKSLEQTALPSYTAPIAQGDTVYLGWMYERALLIAPTVSSYSIASTESEKLFIHADMFAAFLSKRGHPSPLQEDFQLFCRTYDLGVVDFVVGAMLYEVDCNTFAVVERRPIEVAKGETMVPFYSRVQSIDANWWGEGSAKVENYEAYYTKLLGVKP